MFAARVTVKPFVCRCFRPGFQFCLKSFVVSKPPERASISSDQIGLKESLRQIAPFPFYEQTLPNDPALPASHPVTNRHRYRWLSAHSSGEAIPWSLPVSAPPYPRREAMPKYVPALNGRNSAASMVGRTGYVDLDLRFNLGDAVRRFLVASAEGIASLMANGDTAGGSRP
jgi:hypothetical protein